MSLYVLCVPSVPSVQDLYPARLSGWTLRPRNRPKRPENDPEPGAQTLKDQCPPEFWKPERVAASRAMRSYALLWAACPPWQQSTIRSKVHALRASGLSEDEIGQAIVWRLKCLRPWRFSNAELAKAIRRSAHWRVRTKRT